MSSPSRRGWWILLITALGIVTVWPPQTDRSLAVKFVNWAVDPGNKLPVLPPQLEIGMGDDPYAVEIRDAMVQRYDTMYDEGGLMRARLEYKVARDPFNPSTERQVLLMAGVIVAFLVWRLEGRRTS